LPRALLNGPVMIWTEPSVAAAGGAAPVFVKSGEGDANKDASTNIAPSPVDGSDELARLARILSGWMIRIDRCVLWWA
jgi:hypothetical protein